MLSAVIKYVREFLKEMKRDHVSAYAAQAAYFTMLSFIPFVLLLLTLLQYTALTKENLYAVAQTILPDSLDRFVIGIVDEVYNRGALFTSLGWFAFSTCFSIYVDVSASFTNMYGSLTTIILVMLWLYACMYIMLIGAELNAYFEDQFYQLRQARKQARHGEKKGRE